MHKLELARQRTGSICSSFSASFMSNAKWVKFLSCISEIESITCKANVKLVWDSSVRDFRLDDSIEYKFDYYDTSMESMISGIPKGWYDYKELEWVEISATQEQLKVILENLNSKGSFEIEELENSIKIYAYKNI